MIDNASPLSRHAGTASALIVGLVCALHSNPHVCRAQDAPKERGFPVTLKPGDVVTFVDADGQRIALTVANITPKTTTSEAQPVQPETVERKEQPKRAAGSDHVAGKTEKIPSSEERFRKLSTEFAVPDSPAAHVLGVASEKVIHAETPKQLVTALDFLLHFRYRSDEKIPVADALPLGPGLTPDPAEMFVNQDAWLGAAGLRLGRKDFFVTGTATYTNLRQHRRGSDDTFRYSIALEKKITSNTWLSLSLGTETGGEEEKGAPLRPGRSQARPGWRVI